jgi:hypothetical protein
VLAWGVLLVALDGCSSDAADTGSPAPRDDATTGDVASDSPLSTSSCVQPGDHGNELGIGEYCTPGGGECRGFALAPLCLAEAAPDDDQWFCTRILCTTDDQCGSDTFCLVTDRGSACVPLRCVDDPPDGGTTSDAS